MTDAPKLKPCPFCGGVPELNDYRDKPVGSWVLSHKNNACTFVRFVMSFSSAERAVTAWNTRSDLIDMNVLERVEEDLCWIVEPIKCLQIEAMNDGRFIDGQLARALADDIAFARGKAKRALTDLRAIMGKLK